jgi:adiponectin receptor
MAIHKRDTPPLDRPAAAQPASTPTPTPAHGPSALLAWAELPLWQRDNAYIRTHYRRASHSVRGSLATLLTLHNETVNIHTHLLAGLLFALPLLALLLPAPALQLRSSAPAAPPVPRPLLPFYLGAVACLLTSAAYHTLSAHSARVARLGNQADYVGIVALIAGSFVPSIYYGFCCTPALQTLYWGMIGALGVGCTVVSVDARFRTPQWRPFRAGMFVAMGLSAVVPVAHGVWGAGWRRMEGEIGLRWVLAQGVLYVLGAGIYAVGGSLGCGGWKRGGSVVPRVLTGCRQESRRSGRLASLMFGGARTRYFMFWWCWRRVRT